MERVIHTVFRTKYLKKKTLQNIHMLFSQVFSSRSFIWAPLYLWAVGQQNTDRNWICSKNKQKMCNFVSFKTLCQRQFFTTIKGIFKNRSSKMELAVAIINGSPIYAKSPVLARRLPDLSSITHIIVIL